jgi:hypothetical protein
MIRFLATFVMLFKRQALVGSFLFLFLGAEIVVYRSYWALFAVCVGIVPQIALRLVNDRSERSQVLRLVWQTRRFRRVREGRITLCFAPELADNWDLELIRACCRREFDQLARTFSDVRLRRAVVYLLADATEVSKIFGRPAAGLALVSGKAIVIAEGGFLRETIRHELVHLFAGRWKLHPPSILREGLAVYLAGERYGQPLDSYAYSQLKLQRQSIISLLDEATFHSKDRIHASYAIAGSFTGFLIRRFGWEKYQCVYRTSTTKDFEAIFQRVYSFTVQEAESQWRCELIVTSSLLRGINKHAGGR